MREDEMEALLKLDGAGLRVRKVYAGYEAEIRIPHDLDTNPKYDKDGRFNHCYLFSATGVERQEAIAKAWQDYQTFMTGEHGQAALKALQNLEDGNKQLMFRI
jgi:hypothetical protein